MHIFFFGVAAHTTAILLSSPHMAAGRINIGAEKITSEVVFSSSEVEKISSEVNVPHPDVGKTVRKISACRGAKK